LPAGLDEDLSESVRHLGVELMRINRAKCPYILFGGSARYLQSQGKR
jgi:hypothetical protein